MRGIRKIILLLTVVAIVLAGSTIASVDIHKSEEAQQEKPTYEAVVQPVLPAPEEEPAEEVPDPAHTEEELNILAVVIYQEAGGDNCSDDTRRKVGSVFLNRVASPLFPDTFEEVATGEKQYGTLYLTGIKWPDRATQPEEAHAVERAYRIAEELLTDGSILPAHVIWQAEFKQGDGVYCYQDGIYFCYSEVRK